MLSRIIGMFITLIRNMIYRLFKSAIIYIITLFVTFGYYAYKNDLLSYLTSSDPQEEIRVEQASQKTEDTDQEVQDQQNHPGGIGFVDIGMITDVNYFDQHPVISGLDYVQSYWLPYELKGKVEPYKYKFILIITKKYYGYHLKVRSVQEVKPNVYKITVTKEFNGARSIPANTVLAIEDQKVDPDVTRFRVVTETGEQLFATKKASY